jgi:putative ABC transport system permease protein
MFFFESLRMASSSLWGHKLRSLLTILGVIIGVGSVLAVVILGSSFEQSITSQFDDLDNRTIFVSLTQNQTSGQPGPPNAGLFGRAFTDRDAQELSKIDGVEIVVPSGAMATRGLQHNGSLLLLDGVTATRSLNDALRDPALYANGTVFNDTQAQIVLGDGIARLLGKGTPPKVGDRITILLPEGQTNATLAGILAPSTGIFSEANTNAYVPFDVFYNITVTSPVTGQDVKVFNGLVVYASSPTNVNAVRDRVRDYLESDASDLKGILPDGLTLLVATPGDITDAISGAFAQVTLFVAAIAVVSLVVGAIGIANIMLVAVTERTREIGVMKALGGKNSQILFLFLMEATLVGILGAVIGIGLGIAGGGAIVNGVFGSEDIEVVIPYDWVMISLAVGVGVGIVAGYLPARRATRIEIVKALSYD